MMFVGSILDGERLTLTEAARRLNVHVSTLHRWRTHGTNGHKLRCIKIGPGKTAVLRSDLESFLLVISDPQTESAPERSRDLIDRAERAGQVLDQIGA